jgi:eukaryotic-like serine/threonine-protein kinase
VAGNRAKSDIELYDIERGTATRLTTCGNAEWPIWSPDGRRVLFSTVPPKIVAVPADGGGGPETILSGASEAVAGSWSKDGKWLAYLVESGAKSQIWVRPMAGQGEPRLFLESTFDIQDAEFSPDGKWIAYTSAETGSYEIYVQAFPGPGGKHRLSTAAA